MTELKKQMLEMLANVVEKVSTTTYSGCLVMLLGEDGSVTQTFTNGGIAPATMIGVFDIMKTKMLLDAVNPRPTIPPLKLADDPQ